jgi:predicted DNA-binding protein (MmcQ/YjbR family)
MTPHDRLMERLRAHCLAKAGTSEELPFDDRTVVFKVGGKMFCLVDAFEFEGCGMKCAPARIPELRATYVGVTTGPYLHPQHWNSVHPEPFGDVPWDEFLALVDHSYDLVWQGLTRKMRLAIESSR